MARRLDYMIGLNIDASKLNGQLTQAFQALRDISKNATGNFAITDQLKQGVVAANQIESILKRSLNMETGKLDLAAFQRNLASSGTTLATLQQQMTGLGNDGARAFQSIAQSIASAEVPINHNMKLLDSLWVTMKNTVRWQITTSALRTFIGSIESAMGYVKDLDESLNNIRIVTGQSAEQMGLFAERANQAAQRLSTTTTEYTDASLIYYQQGLSDKQVKERTDITVKLANVSGQSAEDVSEQLTAVWNNFDDGTVSLEHYADVMTKLGAETASSSDEIAEGLQKFAAVASTVGMSYDASAAALATLTAETRESASVVGTSLRTLFSRLQGLKLGDTLEDGTDLNKYSQALATVGVDIKDTSGELKEMEEILFELGEVWPTLARDQQVALATTVAGVRQYTQLISLMENWGKFQDNLKKAQTADGTLDTQADIYAESWEAARDRVKNATQDIYDSLLDPQFFTTFDNGLQTVLHGIADVIDGFGGFAGVISMISNLMLTAFGTQIASGIRSIGYEFGFVTKQTNETLEALRSEAIQLAKNTQIANDYVETFQYRAPLKSTESSLSTFNANLANKQWNLGPDYDKQYTASELKAFRDQIINSQNYKDIRAELTNWIAEPPSALRSQMIRDWGKIYQDEILKRQPSVPAVLDKNNVPIKPAQAERPGLADINNALNQYNQLEVQQQNVLDNINQIASANQQLNKIEPFGQIDKNAVANLTAQAKLQDNINSRLSSMNGLERERVQAMTSQIDLMQQSVDLITKEGRIAQQNMQEQTKNYQGMVDRVQYSPIIPQGDQPGLQTRADIVTTRDVNKYNQEHDNEARMLSITTAKNYFAGMGQDVKNLGDDVIAAEFNSLMATGDLVSENFAGMADQITALAQRAGHLKVLQEALAEPGVTADQLSEKMQSLAEQINIVDQTGKQLSLGEITQTDVSKAVSETTERLARLKSAMVDISEGKIDARGLDQYTISVENAIAAAARTTRAQESMRTAIEQTNTAIENGAYKITDYAQRAVTVAQSLTQFGMMASSLNGVMNSIQSIFEGTADMASVLTSSLFGIGMAATSIVGITGQIRSALSGMVKVTGTTIAATQSNAIAQQLATKASTAYAAATAATTAALSAEEKQAMATAAKQQIVARTANMIGIGLGVATIAILALVKAYDYASKAGERAREAIEDANNAYKDQASTVESLENELTQKQERLEELAELPSRTNKEQEELEVLKQQIPYLERKLKLAKENLEVAQAEALISLQENMDTAYEELTTPGANSAEKYYSAYVTSQDALEKFHPDSLESLAQADYYMQFGDKLGYLQTQIDATIAKRDELLADKSGDVQARQQEVDATEAALRDLVAQYDAEKEAMDAWTEDWINNHLDIQDEVEEQMTQWSAEQAANFNKLQAQAEILLDSIGDDFQGWITKRGNAQILDQVTTGLSTAYKNMYGEADYADTFLQPLMESTGVLDDIKQKVASFNQQEITIDADPYREELARSLVSTDDFVSYVQERVVNVQNSLNDVFQNNTNLRDSFIEGLSDAEYNALFKIDLEGVEDFNDLYTKIYELTSNQQVVDLDVGTETLSGAVDEILNLKKDEFALSPETIAKLQEQFAGIFDFRALPYESLVEQAQILSEAFAYLSDPDSMIKTINEGLSDMQVELRDVNDEISDTQKSLSKLGPGAGKAASEMNKELTKLKKRKIQIEVDTKTAQKQLQKINEFKIKDKTFELKMEGAKAILAEASAIEKAAQFVEKGWKVSGQNIAEFVQTWPEALKGAQVDMVTGLVQLDEQWLAHLKDTINQSVAATVLGANAELNTRLAQYSTEMDYLSQVAQAAEQGSHDALTAVAGDSEEEVRIRNMAFRDIVMAKIEQCVQEKTQTGLAAENAIDAQNQVTDASNKEGNAVANNWGNVAVAVEKSLWDAFSAGSQYQQALASGEDMGRIAVKATSAVGMQSSGSSYKAPALGGDKGAAGSGGTGNSWEEPDYADLVEEQLGEDMAMLYRFLQSDMQSPFENDENGTDWKHYSELNPEGAEARLQRMVEAGQSIGLDLAAEDFMASTPEGRYQSAIETYQKNTSPDQIRQDAQAAWDRRMHINAEDILRAAQGASPGGAANDAYKNGEEKQPKEKSPSEKQPKEQKTEDLEDPKKLDDILERYHEITRAIEDQEEILEDIDNYMDLVYGQKRLDQYNVKLGQLNKQMDNYKQKMAEAQSYIPGDREAIQSLFPDLNVQFDEFTGEIKDYHGVVEDMLRQYNAVIEEYNTYIQTYNAMTGDQQDEESVKKELDAMKKRKEDADELLDKQQEALDRYEETLDTIKEVDNEMQEIGRNMEALRLDQIVYKVEVVTEVKDTKDAVRDFQRNLTESFSDSLYNSMRGPQMLGMRGAAEQAWSQAMADRAYLATLNEELSALENRMAEATDAASIQDIKDQMIDLQGAAIETGDALVEWLSSLNEMFPQALEDASARFEVFTNQLEHNKTILETMQELYALQGQTYKTLEGFNRLQKAEAGRRDTASSLAKANREWAERARADLQMAIESFNKAKEEWMSNPARDPAAWETSTAYNILKPEVDALLAEYNEAQEAMYSSAQEAMEIAQEMYLEQIERAVYEFGQALSNDLGLDLLQTKYDHYIEEEERYVDKVNEAYQVSQWYLRLQKDIEKNQNEVMDKRLKDLMDEVHLRRENNTLSQYDLDILEAKYEVLKAQMALEDAQENRNQLRLVRDRQGNWNYQFTADPDELADREKEVLDKQSEWYNLAKGQVKDVTGQIIDTWTQCQDDIKEIYSDMTLTDQERADRAAEIYDYYTEKVKYLESEKQLAIQDMTEAGNNLLFDSAVVSGDQIKDLTQITADDIKQITEDSGASIIELLVMNNDQIKDIVGSNTQLIDNFTNTYGTDLDRMTANTSIFESNLKDTLDKCQTHFEDYYNVIDRVNQDAGTALGNMDAETDVLTRTTDNLRSSTNEATNEIWNMVDAVQVATLKYKDLAESIRAAIDAANQLATKSGADISSMTGMTDDEIDDYDALIEYGLVSGAIKYGDRVYEELFGQREDKIDTRGWRNLVDYAGEAASQHYANIQEGDTLTRWTMDRYGGENSFKKWAEDMKKLGYNFPGLASLSNIASMATGGYTGEFEDGKLAFLHEKELVLNEHDTENILSAINMLRILTPDMLSSISDQLRMTARVTSNLMDKMLTPITVSAPAGTLDQNVHIEATFPNVTDSSEILDAFNTLTNDAAQWARLRRG